MTDTERVIAGRYRLTTLLGRGGMGAVWCADDQLLERQVAVKEVDLPAPDSPEYDDLRERVLREARTAARLDHSNVVRIFDVVEESGHPWIVMEILTGRTLADEILDCERLSPERVAEIGLPLLDALEAAHAAGVVHRDVKPGNVQLCEGGRVVLTDFGIASSGEDSTLTRTGEVVGSPAYMSPERARGDELTSASDLFSLGATLYHAVEGQPPFQRNSPVATLTAVVNDAPGDFVHAGALRPVLVGMLAKAPAERWDPQRIRQALVQVAAGGAVDEATQAAAVLTSEATQRLPAPPPSAVRTRPSDPGPHTDPGLPPVPAARPRRRFAWGATGVLLLLVAALAGGGYAVYQQRDKGTENAASAGGPFDPGEGGVPASFQLHEGSGYTIATPEGWYRDSTRWRAPRSADYAYINIGSVPGDDPRAVLDRASGTFGDSHDQYRSLSVEDTTFRGRPAAEWNFSYHDGGADLRASQLAFVAGGKVWVLWWQTKPDTWDAQLSTRQQVISTFRTSG